MTRQPATRTPLLLALLALALPSCLSVFQERQGEIAEVHNATAQPIWITSDAAVSDVLLQLDPEETGPACLNRSGDVDVHTTDPTITETPPAFTLSIADGDNFCNGTYRWDGSTLARIE